MLSVLIIASAEHTILSAHHHSIGYVRDCSCTAFTYLNNHRLVVLEKFPVAQILNGSAGVLGIHVLQVNYVKTNWLHFFHFVNIHENKIDTLDSPGVGRAL